VNLYAYAGSNPVAFTDPFGLCSEPGDSVQVQVTRNCIGHTMTPFGTIAIVETDTVTVWAHRVTDASTLNQLSGVIGGFSGGSSAYSAQSVQSAYAPVMASGMYTFTVPNLGKPGGVFAADGGMANGNAGFVALRADVWAALSTSKGCEIVAHEGVHLVQHSRGKGPGTAGNEVAAQGAQTKFGC